MFEKFRFYVNHSLNDMRVNKRLSFFALLSIAAGVAAIVSLQTLSVMISDTLTGNLQEGNRGDIAAVPIRSGPGTSEFAFNIFGGETVEPRFNETGLANMQAWIDENYPGQIEMTYRLAITEMLGTLLGLGRGTVVTVADTEVQAISVSPKFVDVDAYPLYGEVVAEDGQSLADLVQAPTDIVISRNVADQLEVPVGATLHLGGADTDFMLRGIVPTDSEAKTFGLDMLYANFGFYYLDLEAIAFFEDIDPLADMVYFRLEDPSQLEVIERDFSRSFRRSANTTTTEDLREQNTEISERIDQMVTVMGLVSLLIGSIGIVNTMQVVVRRRITEVAVLKTLGLQANQVTLLFLTEALIMGIIGSLVGVLLGWGGAFLLKSVAESFVAQTLPFRITLAPPLTGFAVGVVVATTFGFLPTLTAGQVRPGIVLRPMDNVRIRAGWWRTLLALVVIIVTLSVVAQGIIGDYLVALLAVGGTFIAAAILYVLLLLLIWLIGRLFPSFGLVDLKIALRQMLVERGRGATTLLALVAGVFSLSLITLFADTSVNLMEDFLNQEGGNVVVVTANPILLPRTETIIAEHEGINGYQIVRSYQMELVAIEDRDTGAVLSMGDILEQVIESDAAPDWFAHVPKRQQIQYYERTLGELIETIDGRTLDHLSDNLTGRITAGQPLTAENSDLPVMVMTEHEAFAAIGLDVGDKLTYAFGSDDETITFEIIGNEGSSIIDAIGDGDENLTSYLYVPSNMIPQGLSPTEGLVNVDIDEAQVPALRRELGNLPGVFVMEIATMTRLIEDLVATVATFPIMVAALGLVVGGIVIANSVALSTMERRHEIAVMKAVGLPRERVLGMLLLENGIMGLIGGLIGVGIGVIALTVYVTLNDVSSTFIPYSTAFVLMGLCIVVSLIAALSSAWGASGEKPLNVLRYE